MNILTVSEDCFPQLGGIATHVEGLSRALVAAGHRVRVLTRRRDVPAMRNLVMGRSEFSHAGIPTTALPIVYSPRNVLRRFQLRTRFAREARRLAGELDADVVTCHHFLDDPDIIEPLRSRWPTVFTNHSSQFLEALQRGEHRVLRRRIAFANAVIAPSRELVEATIACGYPETSTFYVPNGVDPERFHPDPSARDRLIQSLRLQPADPIILCARRPVEKNGVTYFVQALAILGQRGFRISVVFAGLAPDPTLDELPYTTELRKTIKALPTAIAVRMLGGVSNADMPALHAAADLGVLPSLLEATSISGLESLAAGTPVVGTTVGGIPEIIRDGTTGILVPPRDAGALAAAIESLLSDPTRRSALGAAARVAVQRRFSWKVIAERTIDAYRYAIQSACRTAAVEEISRAAR